MSEADEKVAALVLKSFRAEEPRNHLASCPETIVKHPDLYNGEYGCETGCEFARLEATLSCPHGETYDFEYGTFGDIASLIEEIEGL